MQKIYSCENNLEKSFTIIPVCRCGYLILTQGAFDDRANMLQRRRLHEKELQRFKRAHNKNNGLRQKMEILALINEKYKSYNDQTNCYIVKKILKIMMKKIIVYVI